MSALIGLLVSSVALAAPPTPSASVEGGQRAAWAGLGLSAAGSTLITAGGFGFYDGPFDAIDRFRSGADPKAVEPGVAIASGVIVGSGVGLSAVGRPILSFGSALTARRYAAEGAPVSPTLGWVSVGAWAAGVGSWFAASSTGSRNLDYVWVGMRAASFGTGLAQLIQTQQVMGRAGGSQAAYAKPPPVQLVLSPSGGALVGRF